VTLRRPLVATLALLLGGAFAAGAWAGAPADQTTLVYPPFGHCLGIHRATSFHLFVYLGTRTSFNEPAGIAAVKLAVKDDPSTEADDDELTVFGLNSGNGEIIYNTSLYDAAIYGASGSGEGEFSDPLGIAADEAGDVFVADTGNDRIVRLLYDQDRLRWVRSWGSKGTAEGEYSHPSQIALGASGTLYVTDTGNDRVVVTSADGEPLRTIVGDASAGVTLEGPIGLAVVEGGDPWISGKQAFIVVSDRGGTRLCQFSLEGAIRATVDASAVPAQDARFGYLAIDYYGNVYATDRRNSRIYKFDRDLAYVTAFGRPGTGDGELDEPRGIALWRRFGQIFITERAGAQYFWIGTDILGAAVRPDVLVPGGSVVLTYFLTETSRVTLELVDGKGKVVHTIFSHRRRAVGANTERWDGTRGRGGEPLSPGRYALRLTAAATYSSGKYFHDTSETPLEIR
jgi:hypothetical protein